MTILTIKFSEMTAGGDLPNNSSTPGLLAGGNVLFNNPWTFLAPGTTGDRPIPSAAIYYRLRFNTTLEIYEYYDPTIPIWVELSGSGTGTVNPGVANDIAFYAASGQAVSPIASANNSVLVTSNVGLPSLSTVLPSGLSIPGATITASTAALLSGSVVAAPVAGIDITNKTYVDALVGGTVLSITGTTNQVIASSPTGNVTLSLPQDIALGSTPTFAGLTLSSIPLGSASGGTGINNGTSTLTLAGNLATVGGFASIFTMTGATNVTFPTSGTLATTAGTVSSVTGTANRITSTGGTTPVIDISAAYVGQASITTLGTIGTGVWQGSIITGTYGGTGVNNGASTFTMGGSHTLSGAFASTFTFTGITNVTFPTSGTLSTTTGTVTSVSGTTNRITSTGGATPVIDISASYVGQSSITTLGTITTGVWTGTTIAIANGGTGVTSVTTAPTATSFAGWDANSNLSANNFLGGFATTVTAAATTTLTVASKQIQEFTGATTQTVVMPVASTLVAGTKWMVINNSSGNLTINSSGGNLILTMAANTTAWITCVLNSGTTAASWNSSYLYDLGAGVLSITGTANQVVASASTGAVTLSLPQSIATGSSPTFAALTLTNPYIAGAGGLHSFQIFTSGSAATYTRPANVKSILIEVVGGGGAGGGVAGAASSFQCAAGGGGGGYARLFIASAASTYTYTVGAAGTGGGAGNTIGNTGGTTSFSTVSATGGAGGTGSAAVASSGGSVTGGGLGGAGSGGDFNAHGTSGGSSMFVTGIGISGFGGASIYGGGAAGQTTLSDGIAGTVYGGGGSGGRSTTTNQNGGAGAAGIIIVWEFA